MGGSKLRIRLVTAICAAVVMVVLWSGQAQAQYYATVQSLGCPTTYRINEPFTCNPVISTNIPAAQQVGMVYNWTGNDGLQNNGNNTLQWTTGSNSPRNINLSVTYPNYNSGYTTSTASMQMTDAATITVTVNCPNQAMVGLPFTCTASVDTDIPEALRTGATFQWSGDSMVINQDGTFHFTVASGYFGLNVRHTVTYPNAGRSATGTKNMTADVPTASISYLGCPPTYRVNEPFNCSPIITTNLLEEYQTGRTVTYAGTNLQTNANGSLQFTKESNNSTSITATVKYPNGGNLTASRSESMTDGATINVSLTCPSSVLINEKFTCTPAISTDIPEALREGAVLTYYGSHLQQNADGTLQFTSSYVGYLGPYVYLQVDYPLAGRTASGSAPVTRVKPNVSVSSTGCPATYRVNEPFICNPTVNTTMPESYQAGKIETWTGENLQTNANGTLQFTKGSNSTKSITYKVSYPAANNISAQNSSNMTDAATLSIGALNCPATVPLNTPFTCNPSVETDIPEALREGAVITYSGNYLQNNANGTRQFTNTYFLGNSITYSINYPLAGRSVSKSQAVTVFAPTATITALNCPVDRLLNEPFTCTPQITTNIPAEYQTGVVYTWTASGFPTPGLQENGNNNFQFTTTGAKSISLEVTYPNSNNLKTAKFTQSVGTVVDPSITVSSAGCPEVPVTGKSFTCTPAIDTNLPASRQTDRTFTWTSDGLIVGQDGSLVYSTPGVKTMNLVVKYPSTGLERTIDQNLTAISPQVINIRSFGCPSNGGIIVNTKFHCDPVIETNIPAAIQEGRTFSWSSSSGLTVDPQDGGLTFSASGTRALTLKVDYPLAQASQTKQESVFVTSPMISIASLGCPASVMTNQPFTCSPSVTINVSEEFQEGKYYTWSGDGLTKNANGTLQYSTSGAKVITLTATYPIINASRVDTQRVTVGDPTLKVTSLGCPTTWAPGKPFTCTPVITTNLPEDYKEHLVYTWTGEGLTDNGDGTLTVQGNGNIMVQLGITHPTLYTVSGNGVQTINFVEPTLTITSLGCPSTGVAGGSFTCKPTFDTNIPTAQQANFKYVWTGSDLTVNTDGSLTFTAAGSKSIQLNVSYEAAGVDNTSQQAMTIVAPSTTITSLGCPATALIHEKFTCTPVIQTNLPEKTLTWSGDGIVKNDDGSLTFTTPGSKTVELAVSYPGGGIDSVISSQQVNIENVAINITALGCPATVQAQESFSCTPTMTLDMPEAFKDQVRKVWWASGINAASDGSISLSTVGTNIAITLTAEINGMKFSKTESITVTSSDTVITSLGCPTQTSVKAQFTCTPVIATNLSEAEKANLQYQWIGEGLVESGGQLSFTTSGAIRGITLKVTNPVTSKVVQRTESIFVVSPVVSITALGCPSKTREDFEFACSPTISTNMSEADAAKLVYKWTGDGLVQNEGTFMYPEAGYQTLTLTVSHPDYTDITATKSVKLNIMTVGARIVRLGCPTALVEYRRFKCSPILSVDSVTAANPEQISYRWTINGQVAGTEKVVSSMSGEIGDLPVSLYVKVNDPDSGKVLSESTLEGTIPVSANTTPLRLTVKGPRSATAGSTITLQALTSFQNEAIMSYNWTVDGRELTGKSIQISVPRERTEPIEYTIKAKPACCSMIAEETRPGKVYVQPYEFPNIVLTAPRNAVTNIAPYKALFKVYAVTTADMVYTWDFGDGTAPVTSETVKDVMSRPTSQIEHIYEHEGEFNVTLTVRDPYGMTKTVTSKVYAYTLPSRDLEIVGSFSNTFLREPVTGYFKYQVSGGLRVDTPISNVWSVNGASMSERPSLMAVFQEAGTYTVGLQVKTKYGNTINATKSVTVVANQPPVCSVAVAKTDGGAYGTYTLTANCSDPDGKIVSYSWNVGGVKMSRSSAYLIPRAPGVYPYTLTATDDSQTAVTVEGTVTVQ